VNRTCFGKQLNWTNDAHFVCFDGGMGTKGVAPPRSSRQRVECLCWLITYTTRCAPTRASSERVSGAECSFVWLPSKLQLWRLKLHPSVAQIVAGITQPRKRKKKISAFASLVDWDKSGWKYRNMHFLGVQKFCCWRRTEKFLRNPYKNVMAFLRRFSKNEMNLKTKVSFVDFYEVKKSIEFIQLYKYISTLFICTYTIIVFIYFVFYKELVYILKKLNLFKLYITQQLQLFKAPKHVF